MSANVVTFPPKPTTPPKRAPGNRVKRPRYEPSAAERERGEIAQAVTHLQADLARLARELGEATLRLHRLRIE